jgi:hypothetical protein
MEKTRRQVRGFMSENVFLFSLYSSSKWTAQVQVMFLLYSLEDADFEEMTSSRCKAVLKPSVEDGQEK